MNIKIFLIEKKAKRFFLSHRKTSYIIGLFFICCYLYVDFVTLSNTCHKIDNLEHKEGVVSYWNHTGGEFNDATLKIKNDTNVYITQRYDGWLCFQHNGKKGETVTFYTVKDEVKMRRKEYLTMDYARKVTHELHSGYSLMYFFLAISPFLFGGLLVPSESSSLTFK